MSGGDSNRKRKRKGERKSNEPAPRKNTKVTGERSEAAFLSQATDRGFGIARPWGDSRRYDFIIDNGGCLHRVQVKCTESIRARAYETRATYSQGSGRAVYTKRDIDFIAAHVVPLNIWYIIPVEVCTPAPMLRFYPHRKAKKMRLEGYREAWHLLESDDHGCKIEIQARADETIDSQFDSRSLAKTNVIPRNVILSEEMNSQSEFISQSKDPYSRNDTGQHAIPIHHRRPVRIKPGEAPWPTPPLRILARRQGKNLLPNPAEV